MYIISENTDRTRHIVTVITSMYDEPITKMYMNIEMEYIEIVAKIIKGLSMIFEYEM
jgi:hypothetical protein